jgi:hypothetical protein
MDTEELEHETSRFFDETMGLAEAPLSLLSVLFPAPTATMGNDDDNEADVMADISMVTDDSFLNAHTDEGAVEDADLRWFMQSIEVSQLDRLVSLLSAWASSDTPQGRL